MARLWGKDPDWLYEQDHGVQVDLLAWYRIHMEGRKR